MKKKIETTTPKVDKRSKAYKESIRNNKTLDIPREPIDNDEIAEMNKAKEQEWADIIAKMNEVKEEFKIATNEEEIKEALEEAIEPKGLGDTIHNVLNSELLSPLTNMVKKVIFKDPKNCGCEERQKELNKLFPYKSRVNWLSESDYLWVEEYMTRMHPSKVVHEDLKRISEIHASVFGHKFVMLCSCNGKRVAEWRQDILKVYAEVKKEQ